MLGKRSGRCAHRYRRPTTKGAIPYDYARKNHAGQPACLFNLEVSEEQRRFVASNLSSVASCYVLATNGGHPFPFIIYADEQPVGFVMITHRITGYEVPSIADDGYCILRLMIDRRYQNRGYGREAMVEVLAFIRNFPAGPATYCWISYKADNAPAKRLYESFGFRDNGDVFNEERITVLRL